MDNCIRSGQTACHVEVKNASMVIPLQSISCEVRIQRFRVLSCKNIQNVSGRIWPLRVKVL